MINHELISFTETEVNCADDDHMSSVNRRDFICRSDQVRTSLTPSLPQPVKFPGWKMHERACKLYIFRSYNTYFQCCVSIKKSFHMPVRKRRQKELRVYIFALLLLVFKWHHGSEGVNVCRNVALAEATTRSNPVTAVVCNTPAVCLAGVVQVRVYIIITSWANLSWLCVPKDRKNRRGYTTRNSN